MKAELTRIDTVSVPDVFLSILSVSDGDCSLDEIVSVLEKDKNSINYLAIESEEKDPLDYPNLYKTIKAVKPKGLKTMIFTNGENSDDLDDLVGAGYAHSINLFVDSKLSEGQKKSIGIMKDNKCPFYVTILVKGLDEGAVSSIASDCKGCGSLLLKQDKKKPLKPKDLKTLADAARKHVWNVKLG